MIGFLRQALENLLYTRQIDESAMRMWLDILTTQYPAHNLQTLKLKLKVRAVFLGNPDEISVAVMLAVGFLKQMDKQKLSTAILMN